MGWGTTAIFRGKHQKMENSWTKGWQWMSEGCSSILLQREPLVSLLNNMSLYQEVMEKHWYVLLLNSTAHRDRWHLPYPGAVLLGTLVAFPAATIDPSDKGHEELLLIDLQGLVFHHAPSASTLRQSDSIPQTARNPEKRSAFREAASAQTQLRRRDTSQCWGVFVTKHGERVCGDDITERTLVRVESRLRIDVAQ